MKNQKAMRVIHKAGNNFHLLIIVSLLWGSCATLKNAQKYYRNNPGQFATDCASVFVPWDSAGETRTIILPGSFIDYSPVIDSLSKEAEHLYVVISKDSSAAAQASQDCFNLIERYKSLSGELYAKIEALKLDYHKPTPDTLKVDNIIYRLPTAYVAREQVYKNDIDTLSARLSIMTASRDDYQGKAKFRLWLSIGLGAVILAGAYFSLKNKFL